MAQPENATSKGGDGAYALETSPSHLIHRAQQFAADRYAQAFLDSTVTQRQFVVLNAVAANEGLTQTDLVRATGIDRSTLAELVARMARRSLISRQRARSDARANTVRLTAQGRAALNEALPLVAAADAAILEALPKSKRAAFTEALQRIARILDEGDAPSAAPPEEQPKAKAPKRAAKNDKTAKAAKGAKAGKTAKAPKKAAKPAKKAKAKKTEKAGKKG